MAFPGNITLVTLTGSFDELPDGGASGSGVITSSEWLVGPTDDSIIPPITQPITLDSDGNFSVVLPANNDPDWAPVGWTYRIKVVIGDHTLRRTFMLDWHDTTANLADVISGDDTYEPGISYLGVALRGAANGVASLNGSGLLPLSQLPPHTHAQADVSGLVAALAGKATPTDIAAALAAYSPPSERVLALGEAVIPRRDVSASLPLQSGTMFMTHFTGAVTQTIQKIQTGTADGTTVGVGATHAWIGICRWDGTNYIPAAVSVDDPTRWAAQNGTYDTQLYAWDHAGEAGHEGWSEVKGVDYAMFLLWIGSGQVPALPAGGGWYQDSLKAPRTNAFIFSQTQPPAAPLSGAFFGPDNRRFQGILLR